MHAQGVFEGGAEVLQTFLRVDHMVEHITELAGKFHGLVFDFASARARVGGRVERAGA